MNHGKRPRRRGFSVLELTIAIAILGVMVAVAGFAMIPYLGRAKVSATKSQMRIVGEALTSYYADKGTFPPDLQTLKTAGYLQKDPSDGWKADFFYSPNGPTQDTFLLISWGADGIDGTEDDIDYVDVINE